MKNALIATIALISMLALSACEEKDMKSTDLDAWKRTTITSREENGQMVPTHYIFDCRHVSEAQNVQYYYSLIAKPEGVTSQNEQGQKETTYEDAQFSIEYYSTNYSGSSSLNKGLVMVNVDFKIVDLGGNYAEAVVTANEETVAVFKEYYKHNPYFNSIKVGDELMRMRNLPFSKKSTNITVQDLPGITNGDTLECR